jgi:phosphoglycolate phosphatase-like HAD superfamily hydrolase
VARHFGSEVYVFSRGGEHRELAEELGASWVGGSFEPPPRKLDAAILFAPAGELVPPALEALDRGATLAIAGIHLSDVPPLDYQRHLFQERSLCSVTANTREDGRELLELAARIPIRTRTRAYPLEAANDALADLKADRVRGAAVLALEVGSAGPEARGERDAGSISTGRPAARLLALDFDGVISDSAPEAFVVALRTWSELKPDVELDGSPDWLRGDALPGREQVTAEPLYASFLELMPLGNRAEDYGVVLDAIATGQCVPDQEAYDRHKAQLDPDWLRSFHKHFYRVRAAAHGADPEAWHGLMGAYPQVPRVLRRLARRLALAVATAKDRGSVARLLAAYGIDDLFPPGRVLDKDTGVSKRSHLEHLHDQLGTPYPEMAFIDDKVNHLDAVAPLGVRCGLAAWGYNGDRELRLARRRGYAVLDPSDLEPWLLGGRG